MKRDRERERERRRRLEEAHTIREIKYVRPLHERRVYRQRSWRKVVTMMCVAALFVAAYLIGVALGS